MQIKNRSFSSRKEKEKTFHNNQMSSFLKSCLAKHQISLIAIVKMSRIPCFMSVTKVNTDLFSVKVHKILQVNLD